MKGSVLKKFLCTCLVTAAAFAATTISASACTTIYVGGDLVEEGTPFVARTEDYGSDYNKPILRTISTMTVSAPSAAKRPTTTPTPSSARTKRACPSPRPKRSTATKR